MLSSKQKQNIDRCLVEVAKIARKGKWSAKDARWTGLLVVMCVLDESNGWIYASPAVPESRDYPHDIMPTKGDHLSVGLFQQQVPMWGTAKDCMAPETSTWKFVSALMAQGLTRYRSKRSYQAVQAVQRSFDSRGYNYLAQLPRALVFLKGHWAKAVAEAAK